MKFYIVANKPNVNDSIMKGDIEDIIIYTMTTKLKHCTEYVNRFIRMKNLTHYINWCDAHSLNPDDGYSWSKYSSTVVKDQFRGFYVTPFVFRKDFICACLRLLNDCIPVGASYELPTEVGGYLATHCSKEQLDEFVNELKKIENNA